MDDSQALAPRCPFRPAPGPLIPWVGDLAYIRDPYGHHSRMRARYGDPFRLPGALGPVVLTGDPDQAREVFALPGDAFDIYAADLLGTLVGPTAMNMVSGEAHRRLKRILLPLFDRRSVEGMWGGIADVWRSSVAALPRGEALPVHRLCQVLSLKTIIRLMLGGGDAEEEAALVAQTLATVDRLGPALVFVKPLRIEGRGLLPWGRFMIQRRRLDALLLAALRRRRDAPADPPGILDRLAVAEDADGARLTDEEALDQALLILFGGHQTTGAAVSWAFAHLHAHPEVAARLAEELAPLGEDPDPAAVVQLPWLRAIVEETLRINPMSPDVSLRRLKCPMHLGDREVPAGTAVGVSIAAAHRDPQHFPEPERFDPERFSGQRPASGAYLPFGGGVRGCIGSQLALSHVSLAVAAVMGAGPWRLEGSAPVKGARHNLVMGIDKAVRVTFEAVAPGAAAP